MTRNSTLSASLFAPLAALGLVLAMAGCPASDGDESQKAKPVVAEAPAKAPDKVTEAPAAPAATQAPATEVATAGAKPEAAKPEAAAEAPAPPAPAAK